GAYSGCWCMWFRITQQEFSKGAPRGGAGGNRAAMKKLVASGKVPGLLGYLDGKPVGWISVAPREEFGRIERSPVAKPVDEELGGEGPPLGADRGGDGEQPRQREPQPHPPGDPQRVQDLLPGRTAGQRAADPVHEGADTQQGQHDGGGDLEDPHERADCNSDT